MLADWMDILGPFSPAEINAACKLWKADNPSRRPNPGHIAGLINDERGRFVAALPKPELPELRSANLRPVEQRRAEAAAILAAAFGGSRRDA
jgi:hypothetical protein